MWISEFPRLLARCFLSQIITITAELLLLQVRILLLYPGLPENYAFFANAITSTDHGLNKTQATQELVVFLYSLLLCLVANERNGDLSLVFRSFGLYALPKYVWRAECAAGLLADIHFTEEHRLFNCRWFHLTCSSTSFTFGEVNVVLARFYFWVA